METAPVTGHRKRGRPLSFDREAALEAAMLLFWKHGYEATSLNDLTRAMRITPPSLYTAFGDKKRLFLEALGRYLSGPITSESIVDGAGTAREAAEGLLHAAAVGFTGKSTPAGCLLASSAISCSPEAEDVRRALARIRGAIEQRLRAKILADTSMKQSGQTAEALAALVMAVIQGMSTLARDGAPRKKLLALASLAMQAWPAQQERRASGIAE